MIKELTKKEILERLLKAVEEGKDGFEAYGWNHNKEKTQKILVTGIDLDLSIYTKDDCYFHCGIKVEQVYKQYPPEQCPDLKCGEVIIQKPNKIEYLITAVDKKKTQEHIRTGIGNTWCSNEVLFKNYTKADGTPIGILEEE